MSDTSTQSLDRRNLKLEDLGNSEAFNHHFGNHQRSSSQREHLNCKPKPTMNATGSQPDLKRSLAYASKTNINVMGKLKGRTGVPV